MTSGAFLPEKDNCKDVQSGNCAKVASSPRVSLVTIAVWRKIKEAIRIELGQLRPLHAAAVVFVHVTKEK